jgi:hypothetical protein
MAKAQDALQGVRDSTPTAPVARNRWPLYPQIHSEWSKLFFVIFARFVLNVLQFLFVTFDLFAHFILFDLAVSFCPFVIFARCDRYVFVARYIPFAACTTSRLFIGN